MSHWTPPGGQQPQPFQPPAASFYGPPPVQKGPSVLLWVVLGVGGALLLFCGVSCGALVMFGLNVAEEEITAQLRDNPKLREHIGEIESLNMDIVASGAQDDSDVFVYRVKGSKGSGRLTIREGTDDDFDTTVEEATLRLPDGTEIKIVP